MSDTNVPQIAVADVHALLDSDAEQAVLYIKADEDTGGATGLDVWTAVHVPTGRHVLTKDQVISALNGDHSNRRIRSMLGAFQAYVDDAYDAAFASE